MPETVSIYLHNIKGGISGLARGVREPLHIFFIYTTRQVFD